MKRVTLTIHDAETGTPIIQTRGVTVNTVLTHRDIFETYLKELGDHLWQQLRDRRQPSRPGRLRPSRARDE